MFKFANWTLKFITLNLPQEQDQMYYFGWIADYPYPQDFLDILFSSGSSYNYGGYSDPQFDSLIQQANQEQTRPRRLPCISRPNN